MKYSLRLGIFAWLICSHFLFAQSGSPLTQQKPEPSTSSSNQEPNQPIVVKGDGGCHLGQKPTAEMGPLEILTDTTGVDFSTYLTRVLRNVKGNWYNVIPEIAKAPRRKRGIVRIEFAILKNGKVAGMKMASTSCDASLDSAAWTGIAVSSPFSPLPSEFTGECLGLRFSFYYNADNAADQAQCVTHTIHLAGEVGVTVSPGSIQLVAGTQQQFLATVTGDLNSTVN